MKKRYKLKMEVKIGIVVILVLGTIITLTAILRNEEEKHIERVSASCAEKGKGIKAYYTKEGDKFYQCAR